MNTNKALYWIALTAVAFGFTSEYQRGGFACLHSVAQCTEARLCRAASHAQHALLAMGVLTNPIQLSPSNDNLTGQADRLAHATALRQAALDRAMAERDLQLERLQAYLAQVQEDLEHAQIERMQVLEVPGVKMVNGANHRVITICPKSGHQIRVEAGPDMADIQMDEPTVEVGDQF